MDALQALVGRDAHSLSGGLLMAEAAGSVCHNHYEANGETIVAIAAYGFDALSAGQAALTWRSNERE